MVKVEARSRVRGGEAKMKKSKISSMFLSEACSNPTEQKETKEEKRRNRQKLKTDR